MPLKQSVIVGCDTVLFLIAIKDKGHKVMTATTNNMYPISDRKLAELKPTTGLRNY